MGKGSEEGFMDLRILNMIKVLRFEILGLGSRIWTVNLKNGGLKGCGFVTRSVSFSL